MNAEPYINIPPVEIIAGLFDKPAKIYLRGKHFNYTVSSIVEL